MTTTEVKAPPDLDLPAEPQRELARLRGPRPGPTLVCIGSLHGNEPAGYCALERVVATLKAATCDTGFELDLGDLVVLIGNRTALSEGRRYVDHDLNRGWSPGRIATLENTGATTAEEAEMAELVESIQRARDEARGPVVLLDLHSTSGDSPPFISVADRLEHRRFALEFQVPVILGIDEYLDGTLLEWIDRLGFLGLVFEGGRHEDPSSVDHNEAAVWIAMRSLGLLGGSEVTAHPILGPTLERAPRTLRAASRGLPRMLEIHYRHELDENRPFRMAPAFRSFQLVEGGTLLAWDGEHEVRCLMSGRLLMPLYQPQGEDGFFVMRPYRLWERGWSSLARRSGLARLLPLLPGIHRVREEAEALLVDLPWRSGKRYRPLRSFGYHFVAEEGRRFRLRRRA